MKDVADASVLVLRANKARATDYVQLVQMAQPELYLTLQVGIGGNPTLNLLHYVHVNEIRDARKSTSDPPNGKVHATLCNSSTHLSSIPVCIL